MRNFARLVVFACILPAGCLSESTVSRDAEASKKPAAQYDVVVYGGTAGGAVAAIAAAREGATVALLEPRRHIGGMVTGGLGATDHGRKGVVGGYSREFFERVGKKYGQPIAWKFEPQVAEAVFRDWLKETGVAVFFEQPLARVEKSGKQIKIIQTRAGDRFAAKVFLDCSYEGDLMAGAGVKYTWGREGQDEYGESLAGRRERSEYHQFAVKVSPFAEDGALLPFVYGGDPGKTGQADKKVQAYNFRMCLCNRPENQVAFPKPPGYDAKRYELLRRYLQAQPGLTMKQLMSMTPMPNGKTDSNNNGPFSTDHIGASWGYPEGSEAERQRIWQDHINYQQGFMYFLANDPSVPKALHDEVNKWGLARDEFVDTANWPNQLYIREARRMIGAYVMRQQDLQTERTKPDSIGMGSYNSDSHHVQRIPTPDGGVINEGDMQVPVKPYEIAYRSLTPKQEECGNLLVPVSPSTTHVAYSSIRMEPVYMIMGHSAGVAAAMAARSGTPVQSIDVPALQQKLREQRQVLGMDGAVKVEPKPAALYD